MLKTLIENPLSNLQTTSRGWKVTKRKIYSEKSLLHISLYKLCKILKPFLHRLAHHFVQTNDFGDPMTFSLMLPRGWHCGFK